MGWGNRVIPFVGGHGFGVRNVMGQEVGCRVMPFVEGRGLGEEHDGAGGGGGTE